ncbi:methyltransferase domain-containing protein [Bacteriovoracaceae bacterium]|nr:methyltransferase domain-containing protein [Bacteriovoracaceae bacterium]
MDNKLKEVQEYYGKTLEQSNDLQTNACCTPDAYPGYVKTILAQIKDEVLAKYYGCGLAIPHKLEGLNILDLGSGAGRDCFILSKLVGEKGHVVGVDMTPEQLSLAKDAKDYHRKKFNFEKSNVEFRQGNIEELDQVDLSSNYFDVIISNCVINLAKRKDKVLSEAYRVLKQGGELYFSDVYADRRIPQYLVDDPVLYGECLSGAMYWNDFENLSKRVGFADPRIVESRRLTINNPQLEEKVGDIKFYSVTYRLFKIDELEPQCEEFGQAVRYKGGMKNSEDKFTLDSHHIFAKGKIERVCGNSFNMLEKTRFKEFFDFYGDFSTHFGIFEGCGTSIPYSENDSSDGSADGGACC